MQNDDASIRPNERLLDQLSPLDDDSANLFEDNLELFCVLVKRRQQAPVLMTQPLAFESAEQIRFNKIVKAVAEREGVLLVDLEAEFRKQNNPQAFFFEDGIHFNDSGSTLAAEIIMEKLRMNIESTENMRGFK